MRLLRFIRSRPLGVLSVLALAFVVWIWRDALHTPQPTLRSPPAGDPTVKIMPPQLAELPQQPPPPPGVEPEKPRPTPKEMAQVLPKLKPGMTRAEVEVLVGAPFAEDIHPATVADGRITYHTTYEADLGPPPTIRPIRPHRVLPKTTEPTKPRDRTVVTLEFDATKPGHPLLGIHYPDPLF